MLSELQRIKNSLMESHCVIGGSARSGTTIIGNLIHSFNSVEYFFEPPIINHLFSLPKETIDATFWQTYECSLFDDLLLGAIAGRNLNFNSNDDSCIYRAKSRTEIESRLSKGHRAAELALLAEHHLIAYKLPAAIFRFAEIQEHYPNATIIGVHRDSNPVVQSILVKGWFSDATLSPTSRLAMPHKNIINNIRVPCWVEEKDSVEWAVLSEVDRAFYYYCQATESLCNAIENRSAVGISYAKLLQSPRQVVASLLNLLRVEPGEMTESIVSQIRDPSQTRPASTLESGRFDKQSRLLTDRISGLLL